MARYNIEVDLEGCDGNAMVIIGRVRKTLRRHDVAEREIDEFTREAKSGDYDHVLETVFDWVEVT